MSLNAEVDNDRVLISDSTNTVETLQIDLRSASVRQWARLISRAINQSDRRVVEYHLRGNNSITVYLK